MILSIQSSGDVAYGTTPPVKFRLTVENKSDTGNWKKTISCNRNLTHSVTVWLLKARGSTIDLSKRHVRNKLLKIGSTMWLTARDFLVYNKSSCFYVKYEVEFSKNKLPFRHLIYTNKTMVENHPFLSKIMSKQPGLAGPVR